MAIEQRSGAAAERARGPRTYTRGCGCTAPLVVLILGLGLALFAANVGIGASVRVPFTQSNLTVAGSVGRKDLGREALPRYVADRVGDNGNFINHSMTLTIGPAEGISVFVLGRQAGAPVVDLRLDLERR
ncbi:MAG TPA: hypothetical protein VFW96_09315 [Thermomicrobiales bacterium]|nr:hypothetical protein [Thermomicrobiales bacterium]